MNKEYEIEPGVFYCIDGDKYYDYQNKESIQFWRDDAVLCVSMNTTWYTPETDWVDDSHGCYPETKYTTHLKMYKYEKTINNVQKVANKIRAKFGKSPKSTVVCKDIYSYECGGKHTDFIKDAHRMETANQPEIKKIVDNVCGLILEKGRPMHECEKQIIAEMNRKRFEEDMNREKERKIVTKNAEDAVVSKAFHDFFDGRKN